MPYLLLPQTWAPDEIIPSSWANNIGDNFTRVDARTGNADPGVPGLLLISNGAASASWRELGLGDFKNQTIPDTALVNPHVWRNNLFVPTFGAAGPNGSGFFTIGQAVDAPVPATTSPWLLLQDRLAGAADTRLLLACNSANLNELYVRLIVGGAPSTIWRRLWHEGNGDFLTRLSPPPIVGNLYITSTAGAATGYLILGSDSGKYVGFDGGRFQLFGAGVTVGGSITTTGQLISNGGGAIFHGGDLQVYRPAAAANQGYIIFGNTSDNYVGFDGTNYRCSAGILIHSGNIANQSVAQAANAVQVGGRTPTNAAGTANAIPITDGSGKLDAWITGGGGGGTPGPHNHSGEALLPGSINGAPTSASPAANAIPIADAAGKLNAGWLPAASGGSDVPVGLICLWNSGTAPTGWTFESKFNGRFPLGAGGALGLTLASPDGGAATYDHSVNIAHGHGHSIGGSVSADASTAIKLDITTPGNANAAQSGHGHGFTPSGSVTGLANPTNVTTGAIGHLPPYSVINYIRKL